MSIPSVRGIACAILFVMAIFAPSGASAQQILGKWECASKSGKFNPDTDYQIHCAGLLHFKNTRQLESTCADGFFPSGAYWEAANNKLILRDAAGKAFADFNILELDNDKLLLERKDIRYAFLRVQDATNGISGRTP